MNKKLSIVILILVIVAGGIFAFKNSVFTGNAVKDVKKITIDAERFKYTPDIIELKKGEKVRININNLDVPHGIRIPAFNVQGEKSIKFIANQTGEFDWYCFIPCGKGHMQMKGKVIVK